MSNSLSFMLAFCGVIFLMFMTLSIPLAQSSGQKRLLRARLRQISSENAFNVSQLINEARLKKLSSFEQRFETIPILSPLRRLIMHAGLNNSVLSILTQSSILALVMLIILLLFNSTAMALLIVPLIVAYLPIARISFIRNRRLMKIEGQLSEALDMMKRALQVGHPFTKTLQIVAEELGGPLGNEFGLAYVDINYGASVDSALNALIDRVPSVSLTALVTTVAIQRESGGSLSETLEKISETIRERFRFQRQMKAMTAESRMAAWALAAAPFVLFIVMYFINPDNMRLLIETPEGHSLLYKGLTGMAIGCFWMRRIIMGVNK